MRKSTTWLLWVSGEAALLGLLLAHGVLSTKGPTPAALDEMAALVRRLRLTDLCLFTEARYTRNLSQADLNTPFQDYPLSLEHFPSGSFVPPPAGIGKVHDALD